MTIPPRTDPVDAVTHRLVQAWRSGTAADAATLPGALETEAQAYAVQDAVAAALGWLDRRPTAWKAGAANRASRPTAAMLPPAGVHRSPARPGGRFHLRGIEAEIAFRLGRRIEPMPAGQAFELARYVDAMCVSIEIVDSRWLQAMSAPPLLKLADLQSHGALVLSDWVALRTVDWAGQPCVVTIDGQPRARTVGAHPCGDPAWVFDWWVRHALGRAGALEAGDVLTTGTWAGIVWARPGEQVEAAFAGIGQARACL